MTEPVKLYGKQKALRDELIASSSMTVRPAFEGRDLHALYISISGTLANLPSVNRRKADASMIWSEKQRRMVPVGRIRKDPKVQIQLAALTKLFIRACQGFYGPVTFGKAPVFVQLLLAEQRGRWDSHNKPKDACDILEEWGVIDDDSRAECWPSKKSDYNCSDIQTTQIFVVRFSAVKQLHRCVIEDTIRACGLDRLPPHSGGGEDRLRREEDSCDGHSSGDVRLHLPG